MTIKEFIEAAMEGGYSQVDSLNIHQSDMNTYRSASVKDLMRNIYRVFLDPEAWKAVGKVQGFYSNLAPKTVNTPCYQWELNFIHLTAALLDGKTLEEYIATL